MPLTQGRGLGLATPLIIHNTANSVSFFLDKKCIYSVAEHLYEHIRGVSDTCFNFTSAAGTSQTKCTVLAAHALQYTHKGAGVRIACIISYQSAKETTSMQCRDQLSHEVTKKVIKAAIKLCMHVICYIWVTLRTCLWNGFQNCPGAAQHCLPHLTHPIQLVRRDWNGSGMKWVRKGRVERKFDASQIRVMFGSGSS